VFNVGSDVENHTVLGIARLVQARLPETVIGVTGEASDRRDYRVSFEKIRRTMEFSPKFSVKNGIAEIVDRLDAGEISEVDDPAYHNYRYLQTFGFASISPLVTADTH
jgi:nucleoside-diphosphate-sugar epimerase